MKKFKLLSLLIFTFMLICFITGCSNENKNLDTTSTGNSNFTNNTNTTEKNEDNIIDENKTNSTTNNNEIDKNFKKAMDDYEIFMDEYIAFMEKYANSNGTDTQLIIDYGSYMQKYLDVVKSFEEWEDKKLNTEETKYYIQVQSRVNQKLIDASLN